VFYHGKTVYLVYTDDTILVVPNEKEIDKIVKALSKNFKVEDQGDLSNYLGVNIERRKDGRIEMKHPTLTLSILKDVGLWENGKKNQASSRTTPAYSTTILTSDEGRRRLQGQGFLLQASNWKNQLPGIVNQARHSMCCPSMCQILHCPQSLTCTSCEETVHVSARGKGQRTYL